ncbi:MAG TPA: hypothetical protein VMW09_03540 [Desulfatiglandales bacterium]|nr:hypothetical protein [Desulfatiglandales bacterium]
MSYYHRPRRRYGSYTRSIGHERALEHIREAEELSRELGGTDKDVKKYFFSLPRHELKNVFDEYGRKYGRVKQEYAEQTFHKWKTGQVKVSGLVAGRLFNLLPPRMPLKDKYALVENLWKEYCPRSDKVLLIGVNADDQEIIDTIQSHLMNVVVNYQIPEPLQRRFNWLAAGDVNIKEQLLNYFLQKEKSLILHAMEYRIPVLLNHLKENRSITHKMRQQIEIGKHKLDLQFNTKKSGIKLQDRSEFWASKTSASDFNWGCLVYIIIALILIYFIYFR